MVPLTGGSQQNQRDKQQHVQPFHTLSIYRHDARTNNHYFPLSSLDFARDDGFTFPISVCIDVHLWLTNP